MDAMTKRKVSQWPEYTLQTGVQGTQVTVRVFFLFADVGTLLHVIFDMLSIQWGLVKQ